MSSLHRWEDGVGRMSHHKKIFDESGVEIGYLRITNAGYIMSAWFVFVGYPEGQLLFNNQEEEE